MGVMYFKRYRMELKLSDTLGPEPKLPDGYSFVPWHPDLLSQHAETKYNSFRTEIDANVFPCLGNREGCLNLMDEITRKDSFLPAATWLARYDSSHSRKWEHCGTIQGIRDKGASGAIQNLGIIPEHRNRRLGGCLLYKTLMEFRSLGLRRALLEVTARNLGAIRLYQRAGFMTVRTVYKAVEATYA